MGSKRDIIYLGDYLHTDGNVYVFRHEGKRARRELDFENMDKNGKKYKLLFHPSTQLVTSEFLVGLLAQSCHKLGYLKFRLKYKFDGYFYKHNKKMIKKHLKVVRKKSKMLPYVNVPLEE